MTPIDTTDTAAMVAWGQSPNVREAIKQWTGTNGLAMLEAILTHLTAPAPTVPTCKTCPHFVPTEVNNGDIEHIAFCKHWDEHVREDGSGYCHRHPKAPQTSEGQ